MPSSVILTPCEFRFSSCFYFHQSWSWHNRRRPRCRTSLPPTPVKLHEQLSASCELIEAVTLIQYKQYDALRLAGATDEIYSPELRKGDFVSLSKAVPKEVAKSAKKSRFDVHGELTEPYGPSTKPMTNGSCPDVQQALTDANNRRYRRRLELQGHIHRVGFDVLSPVPIQQVQPGSVDQGAVQSKRPSEGQGRHVVLRDGGWR